MNFSEEALSPIPEHLELTCIKADNLQTSTVIEDSKKTTTTGAVGATDTTIQAVGTANYPDSGVIWIGSERIEYSKGCK